MSIDQDDNALVDKARCPRCGYDQRGLVESWHDACPLTGVCTECGLEFEWADLFSEFRRRPRWCIEFGPWPMLPVRSVTTFLIWVWPPAWWRGIKMSHPINWIRISLFTLCVLPLMAYLVFAAGQGRRAYDDWVMAERNLNDVIRNAPPDMTVQTLRRVSWWRPVTTAAFLPWSDRPSKTSTFWIGNDRAGATIGARGNPSPRALFDDRYHAGRRYFGRASPVPHLLSFPFIVWSCLLIGHLALAQSRRMNGLRSRHPCRVAAHALGVIVIVDLALLMSLPPSVPSGLIDEWSRFANVAGTVCFVAMPLYLGWWWASADRWYMRFSHPWRVAALLSTAAYLVPFVFGGYLDFVLGQWADLWLSITGAP